MPPPPAHERLDRLLDTLQSLAIQLEQLRVSLDVLVELSKDHETRLRLVETHQHRLTPLVGGLVFLITSMATVAITQWFTRI
ncbi:hypothetical protein [Planctopirus hydrillae]|uniref:Uncharacterized protein n=1 Tax=Planctopirus hydrillae TaxID=1841610 RepID=A0A1C3E9V1_9PLAN|nr:hypothetical protein [Planctopirus hydrillae]ODA30012.1 hypothetical protein A6X21_06650 [Planctopirus hydrillae]